jgi:hypothetical protein
MKRWLIPLLSLVSANVLAAPAVSGSTFLNLYAAKRMQPVGESRLTWLVWDVYDAVLYAPGSIYRAHAPLLLELTYLRTLNSARVAEKSVAEMQRLGLDNLAKAARWKLQLTDWFNSIEQGTRLAAMRTEDGATTFIRDGRDVVGTIKDPEFGRYFFAIWLSDNSLRPDLRDQLTGKTKVTRR